ncbi:hypothetical protein GCM10022200_12510 [Microbacterium awajiense]|uniref:O-antigen/teichoic acid export membrane protein n=1 Tax=Microbacterium awajiense TaxID=415214 RepID=A0ABP7AF44_9MICO
MSVEQVAPSAREAAAPLRRRVTRDSLWLAGGFAATSGSGLVFWLLAALWIPQTQLGVEASILAVVMAAAALASNGPGSALVVMLPLGGPAAREALRRACVTTAVLASVTGNAAGLLAAIVLPTGRPPAQLWVIVTVCTIAWAMFNVQAQALAGASDARGTLIVNGTATLVKLGLLVAFASASAPVPEPLVTATIIPAAGMTVLSLGILVPRALRREDAVGGGSRAWDPRLARSLRRLTAQNAIAVGVVLGAGLSLAFLVTQLASPAQGAIFAIAFQFSVALDLVGVAVATALARNAVGASAPSADLARGYAVRVAIAVGVLGIVATLVTPVMFALLGRGYPPLYGMAVVGLLAGASALRPGYDIWSALIRAQHRVLPVLAGNAAYVAILLTAVFVLVPHFGALGAAIAVTSGAAALAIVGGIGLSRQRVRSHLVVDA